MIIDDAHQVAFIHIPKCGGTSVRLQLAAVDSTGGRFYPAVDHPALGRIHSSHIPLPFLRDHFPAEFEKVRRYRSFAIVREPVARFASATYERLKGFRRIPPSQITPAMAVREAREVIAWLRGREAFCDFDYIHFVRQRDFIRVDGRQVVGNLFALDDMASLAAAIQSATGVALDPDRRENANFASPNPLFRGVRRTLKPIYRRLTSWDFRKRLMLRLKAGKGAGGEPLYEVFRQDREICAFVADYYTEDFAIHAAVQARASQPAA
jgi:hypothetical protein